VQHLPTAQFEIRGFPAIADAIAGLAARVTSET
jgi:hypothetical protein